MMRVVITGGAGYIGSKVVEYISSMRYNPTVVVVDNMMVGGEALIGQDITIIRADVRYRNELKSALKDADFVIHLAAIVGYPACDLDKDFTYDVNVTGTKNVVDLTPKDVPIVFCSTSSVYGEQDCKVTEETTPNPLTCYGQTKLEAEQHVTRHNPFIIFRPAAAFGVSRKLRLDLLPNALTYDAVTSNQIKLYESFAIRPFVHVLDFARIVASTVLGSLQWNTIYNLGSSKLVITKMDLAIQICSLTGANIEVVDGADLDRRNYDISFARLDSQDCTCNLTLKYGVRQVINAMPIVFNAEEYTTPYYTKRFLNERL